MPDFANIGSGVFINCTNLSYEEYGNALYLGTSDNKFAYLINESNADITSCIVHDNTLVIASQALINLPIESITLGDDLKLIGYAAFGGCDNLKYVYIDNLDTWCKISFDVKNYDYTSHPLVSGAYLYVDSNLVTDLTIPNTATSINDYAFAFGNQFTSVTIPDSVTNIGYGAFAQCSGLTSVTIGDNVTSIGAYAFTNCTGLTSATIGDNVTSIGACAFNNCSNLKNVYFDDTKPVGMFLHRQPLQAEQISR